jgi:hypothetical protein
MTKRTISDAEALDQLCATLGDIASTPDYVVGQAKLVVGQTGRTIEVVSGD